MERYYKKRGLERVAQTLMRNIEKEFGSNMESSIDMKEANALMNAGKRIFGQHQETLNPEEPLTNDDEGYYKAFVFYQSIQQAKKHFDACKPLSVLCFLDTQASRNNETAGHVKLQFAIMLDGATSMLPLSIAHPGAEKGGCRFLKWELGNQPVEIPFNVDPSKKRLSIRDHAYRNCLFLPCYTGGKRKKSYYYVVNDEWEVLQRDGTFGLPKFGGAAYNY